MNLDYPFRFDTSGRTGTADDSRHIRDMIEQILFTMPGERVNRPDFGSGIMQLVFAPNSPELAATTQFLVQGALQQWLGERIVVESVDAESVDSLLQVTIAYFDRRTQQRSVASFSRSRAESL